MRSAEKADDFLEYRQTQKFGNNWCREQSTKSVYKIRRTAVPNSALQSTEQSQSSQSLIQNPKRIICRQARNPPKNMAVLGRRDSKQYIP
jgi:hypothetical protein